MSEPFIAEVKIFAGNFAPRGYAFCDGQLLQIAQNTALFSLVGTIYGGDGRTTPQLPNLKDRIPIHPGQGPGLPRYTLGERGGQATHALTAAENPNHNHQLFGSSDETDEEGEQNVANNLTGTTDQSTKFYRNTGTSVNMAAEAIVAEGGSQAHENRQPFQGLIYIIALTGTYPSRS